jgi:hypothetical protein
MAASDPERCRQNALNAVRARWGRTESRRATDALTAWAERWASTLEPFAPHEIAAIGRVAAELDARIARNASDGSDAT